MRFPKTLLALVLIISAVPMFGAAYIKFDGVDGESKAAGHDKWIELTSTQFEGGSCTIPPRGTTHRGLTFATTELPQSLVQACQSQTRFRSVMLDVDGQRHVLADAKLAECPTAALGKNARVVLRLDFASCTTHPPARTAEVGAAKAGTTQRGNATLIGLGTLPLDMTIRRATLSGNTATIALVSNTYPPALGKAITEATAYGTKLGTLVIKSGGQQWSFSKVMFSSSMFAPGQDAVFSFQFESMAGSAPAFQALGGN